MDIVECLRKLASVDNCQASVEAADEIERLRTEIERLREALQNLLDHQNGPPLGGRFGEEWQAAVDQARAALGEEG